MSTLSSYAQSFQPSPITSVAEHYYYPVHTEYAAAITTGAASLGVEVPVHFQHSLLDRYGQHTSWSVAREAASVHDVLAMGFDTTLEFDVGLYQQVATYEHGNGEWEDLARIGAQFDY